MTLPLFSLMITVEVTPKPTPLAEQPSRICGAGPIVSPCGPEQELSGTVKFATIDCVTGGSDANGCIAVVTIVPHIAGQTSIVAAVAPNARTTNVGTVVTAFATIINAGVSAASNCSIQLPAGVPAIFLYQTTDPSTNTPTGTPNTPVTIPPGASRSFYFAITPTAAFTQDIPLNFICDNTDSAPSYPGLNTFMLSVGPALPDMLSVAATSTNDSIMLIQGKNGTGFFAAAAINIG